MGIWECEGQVIQAQPGIQITLRHCSHKVQAKPWDPNCVAKDTLPSKFHSFKSLQQKLITKYNLGLPPPGGLRLTSKTHTSQEMLDSLNSVACQAICKKNVDHFKFNSISEFALIVSFSVEHCASHLSSMNVLSEWVTCLGSTFKLNTSNMIFCEQRKLHTIHFYYPKVRE